MLNSPGLPVRHPCPMANRLLAFMFFLLLAGVSMRAHAQGGPPLITNDPDTPGAGHWEINLAAAGTHASGSWEVSLPDLDVNYGLGGRGTSRARRTLSLARRRDFRLLLGPAAALGKGVVAPRHRQGSRARARRARVARAGSASLRQEHRRRRTHSNFCIRRTRPMAAGCVLVTRAFGAWSSGARRGSGSTC